MMPVTGAQSRDSEVHVMSRNHRSFSNQGSSKPSRDLGVESLEARQVMCATCLALDSYLASMAGSAQAEGAATGDGQSAPTVAPIDMVESVSAPEAAAAESGTKCCCAFCTVSGVTSDGLSTQVQPAASAEAVLDASWFSGQFQGVISAAGPSGS
jgi:hypothetical protein